MAFRNKFENPLHKAATYNVLFTLSGLKEQEIRSKNFLTNPPHDIIARSGGIGNPRISNDPFAATGGAGDVDKIVRDAYKEFTDEYAESIEILKRGHDLFIENVNILSTLGPNNERNLANFTKMEFEMHEPFGMTLIEKIRGCAPQVDGEEPLNQNFFDQAKKDTYDKFENVQNVNILDLNSREASSKYQDNFFDYIYIDAEHTYNAVTKDLEVWYPKLKKNGTLFGDDYYWREEDDTLSLHKAYQEFIFKKNIKKWCVFKSQIMIIKDE